MHRDNQGEPVVVRGYGNIPIVRLVWGYDEAAVYVTNEEQLEKLRKGENALQPVAFRRSDVFEFKEGARATSFESLTTWIPQVKSASA